MKGKPKRERVRLDDEQDSRRINREERDAAGRFRPGNRASSGRRTQRAQLAAAFREAVTPAEVAGIARRLVGKAAKGDTYAARVLLDRTIGRPITAPPAASILDLGPLDSAERCAAAAALVAREAAAGAVDLDTARALSDLIAAALRAFELADLEQRVLLLESMNRELGERQ